MKFPAAFGRRSTDKLYGHIRFSRLRRVRHDARNEETRDPNHSSIFTVLIDFRYISVVFPCGKCFKGDRSSENNGVDELRLGKIQFLQHVCWPMGFQILINNHGHCQMSTTSVQCVVWFGNAKRNEASNVTCKRPWLAIIITQFVFLPEHSANHKFMCCLIVKIKSREHKWHYRMYSIDSKVGTVKVYTVTDKYSNSGKLQINLEAKCAVAVQVKDVLSLMRTKQSGAGNEDEQ